MFWRIRIRGIGRGRGGIGPVRGRRCMVMAVGKRQKEECRMKKAVGRGGLWGSGGFALEFVVIRGIRVKEV